tara:strand:+ start:858 stop:1451 length:594 start_codon:yes stop_codon:yes gene_type:complete
MQKIERIAELRAVQNDKRTAEFVISTESIDRHGTVFELSGWDLTDYQRNPIVCYNHNANGDNPDTIIGTSEVFIEENSLIGRVTLEPEGENEIADKVWRKLNNGTLKMASVGAIPHDARWGNTERGEDSGTLYFTRQELLEWSIVSAGSNRDAHKRNTEDTDKLKEQFKPEEKGMSLATKAALRAIKKVKINTINLT